jgi:hypothetical protein
MNTNTERAAKAARIIVSNYEADSSLEECLSDLLGDLRHMCDKHGLDFAERDEVGRRNYEIELVEEGPAKKPRYTVFGFHDHGGESFAADINADDKQQAIDKARREWAPGNIIVATVSERPDDE